jgi:hypothetical protein
MADRQVSVSIRSSEMSRKIFGEKSGSNRDQSPNQWLEMLIADFGGWSGFGLGTVMVLFGTVLGSVAFLVAGPFLMIGGVLLSVVGWFKSK